VRALQCQCSGGLERVPASHLSLGPASRTRSRTPVRAVAGRKQPEYDIVFKQNVTPEDFFLGVDQFRHQGISCSDELVLKVVLPETKLAEIDLDVRPTFVRVGAPKYKLRAALGERVDETKGNAKWDADKSTLTVTLPIIHDVDSKMATSSANELD
jgi:hypothetical protein